MQIVLVAPQIAPNTGNIIRLAANVGASLHLVEPLGFWMDARLLRRGGRLLLRRLEKEHAPIMPQTLNKNSRRCEGKLCL